MNYKPSTEHEQLTFYTSACLATQEYLWLFFREQKYRSKESLPMFGRRRI